MTTLSEWEVIHEMDLDLQNSFYTRERSLERVVWEQIERIREEITPLNSWVEILRRIEEG